MGRGHEEIRRGLLTEQETDRILELAARGLSAGQIALRMNRHPATVSYAMHRLGLRTLSKRNVSYTRRDGVEVRSFTPEEDALVLKLRTGGMSTPKIARAVTERFGYRRSPHTIQVRLVLLANMPEAA